eukprot:8466898-Alexandrium_andersonii.AAC.1
MHWQTCQAQDVRSTARLGITGAPQSKPLRPPKRIGRAAGHSSVCRRRRHGLRVWGRPGCGAVGWTSAPSFPQL